MRRDKPPPWTLRLLLAENYYTASASGPSDTLKNPETLGLPTASRGKPVCKGPSVKPTEVQKPIHNVKDQTRQPKLDGNNERKRIAARPSNLACHLKSGGGDRDRTGDLLLAKQMLSQLSYAPDKWWAWEDLNFRPHAYQACALAS